MQRRARQSACDRYSVWGLWSCCLPCLPGVWPEMCWVMDGVSPGKAPLSAACSRGKVTEVMPSSGCRASPASPGAVPSLGRSCWDTESQRQPERKGGRCWQADPGWSRIRAVRAAAVAWLGLCAPCRSLRALQRISCAWSGLQNLLLLVK